MASNFGSAFATLILLVPAAASVLADDLGSGPPRSSRDCPLAIAPWARPANTANYDGYYVGGGAVCRGEDRQPLEGTWGWDYIGCCYARRVMLGWWHGRRYQGGTGAYKIEGPPLPHLQALQQPACDRK